MTGSNNANARNKVCGGNSDGKKANVEPMSNMTKSSVHGSAKTTPSQIKNNASGSPQSLILVNLDATLSQPLHGSLPGKMPMASSSDDDDDDGEITCSAKQKVPGALKRTRRLRQYQKKSEEQLELLVANAEDRIEAMYAEYMYSQRILKAMRQELNTQKQDSDSQDQIDKNAQKDKFQVTMRRIINAFLTHEKRLQDANDVFLEDLLCADLQTNDEASDMSQSYGVAQKSVEQLGDILPPFPTLD